MLGGLRGLVGIPPFRTFNLFVHGFRLSAQNQLRCDAAGMVSSL